MRNFWATKFKRHESVQDLPIGEQIDKEKHKIDNPEDAERLYQMGIGHKRNQIEDISKYVIAQYANSLAEGKSDFRYKVNPRNCGGYIYIPSEITNDLVANIGLILGGNFEVNHYRSGHPSVANAIEIKRKEKRKIK